MLVVPRSPPTNRAVPFRSLGFQLGSSPASAHDHCITGVPRSPHVHLNDDDDGGAAAAGRGSYAEGAPHRATVLHDDDTGRSYAVLKKLGAGSFAECVKLHELLRGVDPSNGSGGGGGGGGSVWAGKLLPKQALGARASRRLARLDAATKAALLGVEEEISIHAPLRHPGVIGFEGWFSDRCTGRLVIVLEFAKHGTLRAVMGAWPGGVLPPTAAQRWGAQLLSAVAFLHEPPTLVASSVQQHARTPPPRALLGPVRPWPGARFCGGNGDSPCK